MQSNNNPPFNNPFNTLSYTILLHQMGKKAGQLELELTERKKAQEYQLKVQRAETKANKTLQWENQPTQSKQKDKPIPQNPNTGFGNRR